MYVQHAIKELEENNVLKRKVAPFKVPPTLSRFMTVCVTSECKHTHNMLDSHILQIGLCFRDVSRPNGYVCTFFLVSCLIF